MWIDFVLNRYILKDNQRIDNFLPVPIIVFVCFIYFVFILNCDSPDTRRSPLTRKFMDPPKNVPIFRGFHFDRPKFYGAMPNLKIVSLRSPRIGRTWRLGRRDIWTRTRCACRRSDTSRYSRDVRTGTIRRCDLSPTTVWPVPPTFPKNVRTLRPSPISANRANTHGVTQMQILTRAARVTDVVSGLNPPAWTEIRKVCYSYFQITVFAEQRRPERR